MNSILEALYNGRLRPDEMMMQTHPEYQALGRQIAALTEQWKNRLSEDEFRELESCSTCVVNVMVYTAKLLLSKDFGWEPTC